MGFVTTRTQRSPHGMGLLTDSGRMRVSLAQAQLLGKLGADQRVVVGIRPERVAIVADQVASVSDVSVRGEVEIVEMLGAEQYVHVTTESGSLTARVPRNQPVKVTDIVTLTAAATDLHLFDQETGQALR